MLADIESLNYEYELDPDKFVVDCSLTKTIVCNVCEEETIVQKHYKLKNLYCSCTNIIGVSGGSTIRLKNGRWKVKSTPETKNSQLEDVSSELFDKT